MKSLVIMFAILCAGHSQASFEVGTYEGIDNNRGSFELHIRDIPERRGSFIGLLVNARETKIRAYLIDGFSASRYGFLSMRLTGNYNLGVSSTVPALGLTVSGDSLVLTPNDDRNDMGFVSSITFKKAARQTVKWVPLIAGNFNGRDLVVSNLDAESESTVSSKVTGLTGDFVLRETRNDMYVLLNSELTPTGVKLSKDATRFVVFLAGTRWNPARMLVVDSSTGITIRVKNR
jgi:hypothetical protein